MSAETAAPKAMAGSQKRPNGDNPDAAVPKAKAKSKKGEQQEGGSDQKRSSEELPSSSAGRPAKKQKPTEEAGDAAGGSEAIDPEAARKKRQSRKSAAYHAAKTHAMKVEGKSEEEAKIIGRKVSWHILFNQNCASLGLCGYGVNVYAFNVDGFCDRGEALRAFFVAELGFGVPDPW